VPDGLKDEKYWARRRKNNMAAKRSRDARRMKENQIALRAGFLEKEVLLLIRALLLYMPNEIVKRSN
jgi:leukemia factor-related protein